MPGLRRICSNVLPLARQTNKFVLSNFSSDASLAPFIDSIKTYTHALNFGYSTNTVVNNVTFAGVLTNTNTPAVECTAAGIVNPTNLGGVISLGPSSDILCGAFLYGSPFSLTLKGLTQSRFYRISFFNYPWDPIVSGLLLSAKESISQALFRQDRAFYGIYSVIIYASNSSILFNFTESSHLYALVCEDVTA